MDGLGSSNHLIFGVSIVEMVATIRIIDVRPLLSKFRLDQMSGGPLECNQVKYLMSLFSLLF